MPYWNSAGGGRNGKFQGIKLIGELKSESPRDFFTIYTRFIETE